ncbi:UNVERIFIED_CONTAM: hypothetical protein NY603_17065, partial [Bacteroidetes bacterium 56_B9]
SMSIAYPSLLHALFRALFVLCSAYLAGRDKLQRAKSSLHVGDVALELVQRRSDLLLGLIGLLPRWAVGRDLCESACQQAAENICVIVARLTLFKAC